MDDDTCLELFLLFLEIVVEELGLAELYCGVTELCNNER